MSRPRLQKRLGQHHLVSEAWCVPSVLFLQPRGRRVLEIGPGGGVLTSELLQAGAHVLACEVDPAWAFLTRGRFDSQHLDLLVADVLAIKWDRLPKNSLVTGNLPYNIAGEIILRLLRDSSVERAAFLIQKEVADRLLATPGQRAYGALSAITAIFASVEHLGHVPRSEFRPIPKVDGAFVGLTRIEPPVAREEIAGLKEVIRVAFFHRRKTVRNSCAASWGRDRALQILEQADVDPSYRAERLSLSDFVRIYRCAQAFEDN